MKGTTLGDDRCETTLFIGDYMLTDHAQKRLVERGITPRQVERVLEQPEVVFHDPAKANVLVLQSRSFEW